MGGNELERMKALLLLGRTFVWGYKSMKRAMVEAGSTNYAAR